MTGSSGRACFVVETEERGVATFTNRQSSDMFAASMPTSGNGVCTQKLPYLLASRTGDAHGVSAATGGCQRCVPIGASAYGIERNSATVEDALEIVPRASPSPGTCTVGGDAARAVAKRAKSSIVIGDMLSSDVLAFTWSF
jgi:hypothetical protein